MDRSRVPSAALHFAGHARDGLGIAMWQADGSGPEPAATGHTFVTPLRPVTSHYYVASRDYIDGSARGTAALAEPVDLPNLAEALRTLGRPAGDLVVRLPVLTPGQDREGTEWLYRAGIETRYLSPQSPMELRLAGAPVLELPVSQFVLTEDYRGAAQFADVRLAIVTDSFMPRLAPAADATGRRLGEALLRDIDGRPLRAVVDAIRLLPEHFEGQGRLDGRFGEIVSARIETVV